MARLHCTWRAGVAIALVAVAAGCSARDEIHCVTLGEGSLNPIMAGMSLCFDSRAACEAWRPAADSGLRGSDPTCVGVPAPAWHCSRMARSGDPFEVCLPSLALCETARAGGGPPEGRYERTRCAAASTVACARTENGLACQSTMSLCDAMEEMLTASLKGYEARRCEERHSAPAR